MFANDAGGIDAVPWRDRRRNASFVEVDAASGASDADIEPASVDVERLLDPPDLLAEFRDVGRLLVDSLGEAARLDGEIALGKHVGVTSDHRHLVAEVVSEDAV